jgi:pimeloyl-ACP methyl ester carboxylesterase
MTIPTVASGAAELAIDAAGDGMPVVFLHAGVADRRMWRQQLDALGEANHRYRAIAYDRRGFGDSLHADDAYTQVDDLFRVIDATTSGAPAVLVGCSQGGRIAIDAALAQPARVRALVLVAPAVSGEPDDDDHPPAIRAWIARVEAAEAAADIDAVNALEAHAWLDGPLAAEGRVGGEARALFLAMNDIALRAETRGEAMHPPSAYARVRELAVPTLVIFGELDFPHIARRCRYLAAEIPRATLTAWPDAAHLPSLEQPQHFNEILLQFLDTLPR